MARKTSDILNKEYREILEEKVALEARIKDRAKQLCKKFPDVSIGRGYTAKRFENYQKYNELSILDYILIIASIEKHNEKQSGHVQEEIVFNKPDLKPFIEYEDNENDYEHPERKEVAEILDIRLYCMHDDFSCNKYIKGKEGYNGAFTAETGQRCDLRNQGFKCVEHGGGDKD